MQEEDVKRNKAVAQQPRVFEHILYQNDFRPGDDQLCHVQEGGQHPTSDVLLYVRTGRRVLSKDERVVFICSSIFKLWFYCPTAFHCLCKMQNANFSVTVAAALHCWKGLYPRMTANHGASLLYTKGKGVANLWQNEANSFFLFLCFILQFCPLHDC